MKLSLLEVVMSISRRKLIVENRGQGWNMDKVMISMLAPLDTASCPYSNPDPYFAPAASVCNTRSPISRSVEQIAASGGNGFSDYSLPEAILKFRQGVGRLIRNKNDRGMVVVLDSRMVTKSYGKAFLNALPKCPVEIV
ncbi:MAG: helicase C-terminal domain-containing protein [Chthoniobacterales bacterium]